MAPTCGSRLSCGGIRASQEVRSAPTPRRGPRLRRRWRACRSSSVRTTSGRLAPSGTITPERRASSTRSSSSRAVLTTATAAVYNIPDLTEQYTTQAAVNAPANASTQVLTIPALTGLSGTYFIRLQLRDSAGALVSNNLYWYSTSPDVLSNHSTWYKTVVKSYANLTGLNSLASNPDVTAA